VRSGLASGLGLAVRPGNAQRSGAMPVTFVVSLLTGARTEEMRALRWTHIVALDPANGKRRPVTEVGWEHERFAIRVWRSA
jgi:hypothetical protein